MTNATVKPSLSRIEQKLDKLTDLMNKENSEKDDSQENEGQNDSFDMTVCDDTKKEMKNEDA